MANATDDPWATSPRAADWSEQSSAAVALLETKSSTAATSFADLAGASAVIEGRTLTEKSALIGVPHIITSVAFRPEGKGKADGPDFVSIEATTIDDREIVYNDSSTGVRRQLMQYLIGTGVFPQGTDPDSRVTAPRGSTAEAVSYVVVLDGADGNPRPLAVPHGLRVSHYDHPEHGESSTFYLS